MSKAESSKSTQSSEIVEFISVSKNPDTEGFDTQAGETWIYPTNYPLREYQYNIIQEALLSNTMVSLPTGLGKTFIAAVVMYNFYRWYPMGKVIFMAPTRPLVKQQIDACYNIMAIPKKDTAELTGTKDQAHRKEVWKQKRVFFITPQVLQNDLGILVELGTRIKCIVFDEAHKAKGNYAYCEVIRKLLPQNKYFRVLALSATPGSSHNDVSEVIRNLLISHLEIRTDESSDVTPYVFQRSLETVVVPLGEKLQQVRDSYLQILEKHTRVLVHHRVITGNCSTLTKGKIFMTMKDYQAKSQNNTRDRAYSEIMRNLNICVTLYHAYELLVRHGLRGFLSFFEEHADKPILRGNIELKNIMQDVREYLGPAPNVEPLPDGSILKLPESTKFGHPKFYKLNEILLSHFNNCTKDTASKVIVFCEYRESVMEAYALLLQQTPLIRPRIFLGQGAITQKQQTNVVKAFKEGVCNTLISTSIGEEGLDVGEVDLIVCFDISNKSPVRMVQRMGRTGRRREGRVIVLVTEGKEQQTLKECLIHKQNLANHILQSSALTKEMYGQNPRMVPLDITPKCHKLHITVTVESKAQTSKKKNNNLKDMFNNILNQKNIALFSQDCDTDLLQISDRIPLKQEYWNKGNPLDLNADGNKIDFSKKLSKLRTLQPTGKIGHTKNSELLVSLLQFAESKKYNIPMTQVPVMPSQVTQPVKSRKIRKVLSSDGLKQVDIRNMFGKPSSSTHLTPPSNSTEVNITQEETNKEMLNILYTEISTYLAITVSYETNCKICDELFDCSQFKVNSKEFDIKNWVEPDLSIFDKINAENLTNFADSLKSIPIVPPKSMNAECKNDTKCSSSNNLEEKFKNVVNNENNFEDSFKQSPFKLPKSIRKVLEKSETPLNLNESCFNNIAFTQLENANNLTKSNSKQSKINDDNILCSLNVNEFDEAEFTQIKTTTLNNSNNNKQDTLTFFNITTLEDLFENSSQKTPSKALNLPSSTPQCKEGSDSSESDKTIIYTPEDLKKSPVGKTSGSPVLCSFERVRQLKNKAQKRLFENSLQNTIEKKLETTPVKLINKNKIDTVENISVDIFSEFENTFKDTPKASATKSKIDGSDRLISNEDSSDLDIIDTSLENCLETNTQVIRREKKRENDKLEIGSLLSKNLQSQASRKETVLSVSDMIDLSIFGLDTINNENAKNVPEPNIALKNINNFSTNPQITAGKEKFTKVKKITKGCDLQDFCDETVFDMFFESDPFKQTDKSHHQIKNIAVTNIEKTVSKSFEENSLKSNNVSQNANIINKNTKEYKITQEVKKNNKEETIEWKEDDIWNFCLNSTGSQDENILTNKEQIDSVNSDIQNDLLANMAVNKQIDEKTKNYTEKQENRRNKNESSPNKPTNAPIIDLTKDSPTKDDSPTLIKSQRRNISTPCKSQQSKKLTQKLLFPHQDQKSVEEVQTKSIKTKLQLNSKFGKTSINSKKSSVDPLSNNKTTVTGIERITSQALKIPISKSSSTRVETNSFEDESDLNDSFNFTFNRKRPLGKLSTKQLKISPILENKKITAKSSQSDTTPKKVNPKENKKLINSPVKPKYLNEMIETVNNVNDSDDDFELPRKPIAWIKARRKNILECNKSPLSTNKNLIPCNKNKENVRRKNMKKKSERCRYIDLEAELSMDEYATSDTDCEEIDDDKFEESFVDDRTQSIANNTEIHAHYLQSVRSPLLNHGRFKIPKKPSLPVMNVYSQPMNEADNTYMNDTFCVNTEEMELSQETKTHDISELGLAELLLEQKRIERKRRKKSDDVPNKKRRRILESSTDSD